MTLSFSSFPETFSVAIFGATGGIGAAFIKTLLGASSIDHIYAVSRTPIQPTEKVTPLQADFINESDLARAAEHIQNSKAAPLRLCIVASGILHGENLAPEKSISKLTAENMRANFESNFMAPSLIAKHMLPLMPKEGKSCIAALSARVGSISDNRLGGWHSYRASKAALNMMLKTISIEAARRLPELVILGLHPGTVDTNLSEPFQRNVPEGKLFTPDFSSAALLNVINEKTPKDSGLCFDYKSEQIPT